MQANDISGMTILVGQLLLLISVYLLFGFQSSSSRAAADLAVLLASWFISLFLTCKHKPKFYQRKIKYIAGPYIKAALIMIVIVLFLQEIFNFDYVQRKNLLLSTIFYVFIELFLLIAWCSSKRVPVRSSDEVLHALFLSKEHHQTELPTENVTNTAKPIDLKSLLDDGRNGEMTEQLQFIEENIAPNDMCKGGAVIHDSCKAANDERNLGFILGTERLNDIRYLNRYLSACYRQLLNGGWLVVKYEDIDTVEREWVKKYGNLLFYPVYLIHFLFHRALPKIPRLKGVYFALTKGRDRALSRVEAWGRLSYCGFDVLHEKAIGGENHIIARKTKAPSDNPNPTWYPIITLDRVGLHGQVIKIHKIRTMYPYSEFLQKKVFDEGRLSSTGKFNGDYRITRAGRILRKYWLDELPQFIDWMRGEIKLVGIRAMSLHYFSLYPREYQEMFVSVKPGILSPVFDEGTPDFKRIVETESKYLRSYLKNPVVTDISYFFRTIHQIVFQGTRSK